MARAFLVLLVISVFLGGCTQRTVCPAFQSAFIYDKEELRKRFSYFQEDSTPKMLTASKNKYLVIEPVSYRKKIRSMQTVPMKPVNVAVPDSLTIGDDALMGEDGVVPGAELDLAARSVIDSIYIEDVPRDTTEAAEDSVYMISKDKEVRVLKYDFPDSLIYDPATGKYVPETPRYVVEEIRFNVEQDNYMWYLRDYLVLPDVRLAHGQSKERKAEAAKKEKKGLFKNLFKKKKKDEVDSASLPPPVPKEEFDFVDEDEQLKPQQSAPQEEVKEKKGLFRRKKEQDTGATSYGDGDTPKPAKEKKKKKKKSKTEAPAEETEETKTEEEDDDGF